MYGCCVRCCWHATAVAGVAVSGQNILRAIYLSLDVHQDHRSTVKRQVGSCRSWFARRGSVCHDDLGGSHILPLPGNSLSEFEAEIYVRRVAPRLKMFALESKRNV